MKPKTFLILVCILGALSAAAFLVYRQEQSSRQAAPLGKKFFEELAVNEIASITIVKNAKTVRLKKGRDSWEVADRYGYPADFSKITDLVKKLKNAKVGRSFKATDEILTRLALHAPEAKNVPENKRGTQVVFKSAQEKPLANIIMGPDADRTDVYYLMHTGNPTIYLVDQSFRFLDENPTDWLAKEIVDINEKDIKKIVCYPPREDKAAYTIERPARDKDAALLAVPAGKKVEKFKIDQMLGVLSSLKIEDVADPANAPPDTGFSAQHRFEYHLFDGTVYTISPGANIKEGSDNHFLRLTVAHVAAAVGDKGDAAEASQKAAEAARERNRKLSAWTYVVSKWVFNTLLTRPEDFFEKTEKK